MLRGLIGSLRDVGGTERAAQSVHERAAAICISYSFSVPRMSDPAPFDANTVLAAQAGDAAARDRLLAGLEPILRGFFINRVGKRPAVDDLIQNTLLRVHSGLNDLKNPDRLKAFAMKAALFEVQDLYRGRYGPKETLLAPDVLPERSMDGEAGAAVDAARALSLLTVKARRILELRAYGYRYREIAEMIDSTEAAVKMQVKRAFDKMKDVLAALLVLLLG